jgi:hypothetical protein
MMLRTCFVVFLLKLEIEDYLYLSCCYWNMGTSNELVLWVRANDATHLLVVLLSKLEIEDLPLLVVLLLEHGN